MLLHVESRFHLLNYCLFQPKDTLERTTLLFEDRQVNNTNIFELFVTECFFLPFYKMESKENLRMRIGIGIRIIF